MPSLEAGTYFYVPSYAESFRWWLVTGEVGDGVNIEVECVDFRFPAGGKYKGAASYNQRTKTWKISASIAEPFTEFEYLLLRATEQHSKG